MKSVELQSVVEFLSIGSDTIRGEERAGRREPMLAQVMVKPVACKVQEGFLVIIGTTMNKKEVQSREGLMPV